MRNFLSGLLDWIYKKKCYFCKSSKESLRMCTGCFEQMEHLEACENRKISGVNVYCAGMYESTLQKMIRGLKYHNQRDLAYFQAKFMFEYWQKLEVSEQIFQVVPVPLFPSREKSRKYNHMMLVCEEFCKLSGYELNNNLIKRIRDTRPQYRLSRRERMENLSGAFEIDLKELKPSGILVLDDICTTGSTFENIISEFSALGVKNIVCFATTTPISG